MKRFYIFYLFIHFICKSQISNSNIRGIYEVNITETNCSTPTNYQTGLLFIDSINPGCLKVKDSSYTTGNWFNSSILINVNPDSSISECLSCCLANGKYFANDSIHFWIRYYGSAHYFCAHEYFGKRKFFTGIEDLKLLSKLITIGPIPVYEELQIYIPPGTIKTEPVLYDINGRLIRVSFIKKGDQWKSDISEIATGIYFLWIETSAGVVRKKILIVH